MDPLTSFRIQVEACRDMGSPMYAELLRRAADDIEAGGVVREVLEGHEDDPGPSALGLRLLGSVHRLVLERRAGDLAAFYPSVGGTWEPEEGWRVFERLLAEQPAAVREWLDRPPQTNEVGRSAALYGGLLHLARDLPVRLFEIGSSAGLNLRADQYGYVDSAGQRFGPSGAELVIDGAWQGRRLEGAPALDVVERLGSDLRPVDPSTTAGRLLLTAYVWPDQRQRLDRLRAAFRVAEAVPVEVRTEGAVPLLRRLALEDGATTVLWHSVMWQYLEADEQRAVVDRVEELGAGAAGDRRFAYLRAEPSRRTPGGEHRFLVWLRVWPGGEDRIIGETVGHGVPTTWE